MQSYVISYLAGHFVHRSSIWITKEKKQFSVYRFNCSVTTVSVDWSWQCMITEALMYNSNAFLLHEWVLYSVVHVGTCTRAAAAAFPPIIKLNVNPQHVQKTLFRLVKHKHRLAAHDRRRHSPLGNVVWWRHSDRSFDARHSWRDEQDSGSISGYMYDIQVHVFGVTRDSAVYVYEPCATVSGGLIYSWQWTIMDHNYG